MSLNIKNQKAHRLASKVARITGESMTEAVTRALEERLDRLEARETEDNAEKRAEKWVAIGKEIAARLKEPYKSVEHGDLLYDEMGLPK